MTTSPRATVRITVDLPTDDHADLRRRCGEYADALAVPRVVQGDVLRVLLAELRTDAALADRVRAALARQGGSLRHAA
jgi:hypothetical protein